MAVDITLLFRASVKTVKTRNKALGVAVGGGVDGNRDELFRRSPRPKGDFSSRAREVVSWLLWERRAGGGGRTRDADPRRDPAPHAVCARSAWGKWSEGGPDSWFRRADSCVGSGTAHFGERARYRGARAGPLLLGAGGGAGARKSPSAVSWAGGG